MSTGNLDIGDILQGFGVRSMTVDGISESWPGFGVPCDDCGEQDAHHSLSGFPSVPDGAKGYFCRSCEIQRLKETVPCLNGEMTPRPLGLRAM